MQRRLVRNSSVFAVVVLVIAILQSAAFAQYKVTPLTSDQAGHAPNRDSHLMNAWGLARGATSPWWVSDNDTGVSTLYIHTGAPQQLVVAIPSASGEGTGSPTGIVFNGHGNFNVTENGMSQPSVFIFATLDGLIVGWNPKLDLFHAVIAVNNSKQGSLYTGLAITNNATGPNFVYAADAVNNRVDIYDENWTLVGSFTDPQLPATFAPYNVRDINHVLYVTFASTGDSPGGILDKFSEAGGLIKRLVTQNGPLNQPWGMALAPANFGPFSNALLVSNNTPTGVINAIDPNTGKFLGRLTDQSGKLIRIDQIWGMDFGGNNANNGLSNTLFFTAGSNGYADGLFGSIRFVAP